MPAVYAVLGIALVAAIAVAFWWRVTGPGKRLRLGEFTLYYTNAVTSETASQVGQYLKRQSFTDQSMDARLTRVGPVYQLQLISTGEPAESQLLACEVLAAGLSDDVFAGAAVELQICDSIFRPFTAISHRGRFGRRITMNAAHLFYLEGVTDREAFDVATFLAGVGVFDDVPKIAQMNRTPAGFEFRLAVEVDPSTPELVEGASRMASDLSKVLAGEVVSVHFGKGLAGTLRAGEPTISSHVPGGPYHTKVFCVPGQPSEDPGMVDEK